MGRSAAAAGTGNGAEEMLHWDYSQLGDAAAGVMGHAAAIKRAERRASAAIIQTGRHLLAVKQALNHGQWQEWLAIEFSMSDRTARRMMAAAQRFGGKTDTVSALPPSVLYLLAGDSVPDAACDAVLDLAQGGAAITRVQAQAIVEVHRSAQPLIERASGLRQAPASPRLPISEFELTDICETVAVHFYGEQALATPLPYADMRAAADAKAGPYWDKLMLTLQYYELTPLRIASAIHLQVIQMMHERISTRARQANGQWQGPSDKKMLSDAAKQEEVAVPEDLAHWTLHSDGNGCYMLTENATGQTLQGKRLADLFAQARQIGKVQAGQPARKSAAGAHDMDARQLARERRRHRQELIAWLGRLQALRGSLARWAELTGRAAELAALDQKLDTLVTITKQTLAALASEEDPDSEAG